MGVGHIADHCPRMTMPALPLNADIFCNGVPVCQRSTIKTMTFATGIANDHPR